MPEPITTTSADSSRSSAGARTASVSIQIDLDLSSPTFKFRSRVQVSFSSSMVRPRVVCPPGSIVLLLKLLGHAQMLLQIRQDLGGPLFQVGIVAALGVLGEQINGLLMGLHLHAVSNSFPLSFFRLSSLLWCSASSLVGRSAFTLPLWTSPFSSLGVFV